MRAMLQSFMRKMTKEEFRKEAIEVCERIKSGKEKSDDFIDVSACSNAHAPTLWISDYIAARRTDGNPAIEPLCKFPAEDGVVFDVGAHWGYTAASLRNLGSSSQIVSLEAWQLNSDCLSRLRELDGGYDYRIVALGERKERKFLYTPVVNGVAATALNTADVRNLHRWLVDNVVAMIGVQVPESKSYRLQFIKTPIAIDKLDDVIKNENFRFPITKIAAVKIDVEGFEASVIDGAIETLQVHQPLLLIEGGNRRPEVRQRLENLGYCSGESTEKGIMLSKSPTVAVDGWFLHPSRHNYYREIGILA